MKGTKSNLEIRQGPEEKYQPTLYIKPLNKTLDPTEAFKEIQSKYPGVELKNTSGEW